MMGRLRSRQYSTCGQPVSAAAKIALLAMMSFATWVCIQPQSMRGAGPANEVVPAEQANSDGQAEVAELAEAAPAERVPMVHVVQVPMPIRGTVDQLVQQAIEQIWQDHPLAGGERPVLVLEFRAREGAEAIASQFERALALARYLTGPGLSRVRTVAYLPDSVQGHAVLPVLACEQIVMHPDAELGNATIRDTGLDPAVMAGYREIVQRRETLPEALVTGMLDKSVEVVRVTTATGNQVRLSDELDDMRQREVVQNVQTIKPAGQAGVFTGRALRLDWQLISQVADDRLQLAAALGVGPEQLESDTSLAEPWRAIRVELDGPMHEALASRVEQTVRHGISDHDANLVIMQLNSPGGAPTSSLELARYLVELHREGVRTVCYVRQQARGDAAIVAWAADQLIVHPSAVIGGPGAVVMGEVELDDMRLAIQELANQRGRPWSMGAALVDDRIELRKYVRQGSGVSIYLTSEEADEVVVDGSWRADGEAAVVSRPLELTGEEAVSMRLARHTAADLGELSAIYGLETQPVLVRSKWAYELVDSLARPEVAATLLFLGGFALIIELSSPGLGVGAFLSAVCFILYFWSNYLHGTAEWLEIVLFVLGALFVVIEIFVLPGFGVFGLGGAALMAAALVLASQTFVVPSNSYQLRQVPKSIGIVSAGAVGLMVGVMVLGRYIDRLAIFKPFALPSPEGEDLAELQRRESLADFSYLVGSVGVVKTPLRPSGKVRFGDLIVDVVSDGEAIEVGDRVRVESVDGTRVVVGRAES